MNQTQSRTLHCRRFSAGFTLVEMAVVVTLIGILMAMGLAVTTSVMQNTQRTVTKDRLSAIRLALMAYYRANSGVFPCPDAPAGAAVRDGLQNVAGAACSAQFGTVPYVDLGLPRETALDGYGNYISYRLATNWHTAGLATTPLCASSATVTYFRPPVPAPAITVNYSAGPAATVGIVLISHGSNGFGAWNQGDTTASKNATTGATAAEVTNQTLGATYNDLQTPVAPNATFDDLVATLAPANIICN
jgi:prepilin-type N-terminal cleavage/methylation domain-containing protein